MTGVTARTRRDGSIAYEAQVRRPRPLSPLSKTFLTRVETGRDSSVAFTVKQYYKLLEDHAAAAARLSA